MRRKQAKIATDPVAFEAFYRRHVDAVTRFLARRVDDPHTVADLAAEVFVAVLDSAHTYRADLGTEIAWLYGVARKTISAERRRAYKRSLLTDRVSGRRPLDADDIARLEERMDAERHARQAFEAMAELPAEIAARAGRRRRITRRLYAGGAVAALAAAAAFAVPLLTGTESPAYAVSKKADGTVGVEIREFEDADQLERDLKAAGVRVDITYLKSGRQCEKNRGMSTPPAEGAIQMRKGGLDIDPRLLDEDKTLVLEFAGNEEETPGAQPPKTVWKLTTLMIPGGVGPCVVVGDSDWNDPGGPEGQPPAGS